MSKSNVVAPQESLENSEINVANVHSDNEDNSTNITPAALDLLSPHARAALERILGKPHNPE